MDIKLCLKLAVGFYTLFILFHLSQSEGVPYRVKDVQGCQEVCGNTSRMIDECFALLSPNMLELLDRPLPFLQQKDIMLKCTHLRRDMLACIDAYIEICYDTERPLYDKNFFASDQFINAFCANEMAETAHLPHENCIIDIQQDFEICHSEFIFLTNEERHLGKLLENICCSNFSTADCVYESALEKCDESTAELLRSALREFSYDRFCEMYNVYILCYNAAYSISSTYYVLILALGSLLLVTNVTKLRSDLLWFM